MTDTDETPDGQPYHAIIRAAVLDGCIDATATDDADRIIEYLLSSGYKIVPADPAVPTLEEPGPDGADRPPLEWFANPALIEATPLAVTAEGHISPASTPLGCDDHTLALLADGGWTL